MKKAVFLFALTALMIGMTSMTAFAHGHGRGYRTVQQPRQAAYAVCAVESCNLYGLHEHNGTYYCGPQGTGHGHGHRR